MSLQSQHKHFLTSVTNPCSALVLAEWLPGDCVDNSSTRTNRDISFHNKRTTMHTKFPLLSTSNLGNFATVLAVCNDCAITVKVSNYSSTTGWLLGCLSSKQMQQSFILIISATHIIYMYIQGNTPSCTHFSPSPKCDDF